MTMQSPTGARLKGQEISIRVLGGSSGTPEVLATLDSISEFNDNTAFKLLEDGFLGEVTNRFDEILDGFGGDFTMQVTNSGWIIFQNFIISRATREDPTIVFNVVKTDLFADGSSLVWVYTDVHWGEMPSKVGGRGDFAKVSANFKCSVRPVMQDQL